MPFKTHEIKPMRPDRRCFGEAVVNLMLEIFMDLTLNFLFTGSPGNSQYEGSPGES